jgi:hypothetical protein
MIRHIYLTEEVISLFGKCEMVSVDRVQFSETKASFPLLDFLCLHYEMVLSVKWSSLLGNLLNSGRDHKERLHEYSIRGISSWERVWQVLHCKALVFLHRWSSHVITDG